MWNWHSLKKYLIGLIILLVISLLGVSGYWLYSQNKNAETNIDDDEIPAQLESHIADPKPKPIERSELSKQHNVDKPVTRSLDIQNNESDSQRPNTLNEYTVILGADKEIKIPGLPGELKVWIGSADFAADFPEEFWDQDKTTVPAVGESARVEPFSMAFRIEPAQSQCIKIHPSGSEVRFKLTPQKSGVFDISANVYLFDSSDCSGSPVPKTVPTLKVTVKVNENEILAGHAMELWVVFWEKLLEFWAAFVALVFAVLLFLSKNKFKKWFGFGSK